MIIQIICNSSNVICKHLWFLLVAKSQPLWFVALVHIKGNAVKFQLKASAKEVYFISSTIQVLGPLYSVCRLHFFAKLFGDTWFLTSKPLSHLVIINWLVWLFDSHPSPCWIIIFNRAGTLSGFCCCCCLFVFISFVHTVWLRGGVQYILVK